MPSFDFTDSQWNSIIKAFQHMDQRNLLLEDTFIVDKGSSKFKAGHKLHELGACNNCHFYGEIFPKQGAQTWAPNLAMTKNRLRPDWIVRWLDNPADIMPSTKMPAPYIPDSIVLSLDKALSKWGKYMINANREEMLEALRDYTYAIEGKEDISKIIKEYFDSNGYDFDLEEDDDFDDEEW